MNTNDKTNSKVDTQNKDEAIAEVSAAEADAVAGGMVTPTGEPIIHKEPLLPGATGSRTT